MGQDAMIYVRTKSGNPPEGLAMFHSCFSRQDHMVAEATHEVDVPYRFYGVGYERGPWPLIAGVLLDLLANPDVEKIWYCSDSGNNATERLIGLDDVVELSRHWCAVGNACWSRKA